MTTTRKVTNFMREVMARMKGDTPKAVAEKNYRTADAALTCQIAVLKGKQVKDENAVEDAKEALKNAQYPTDPISDTEQYIENIQKKQVNVDSAQKTLNDTNHSIAYFSKMKEENDMESAVDEVATKTPE